MSEEKNIEKLFSEKLKEFGSPPPPDLKRSVEQSLIREKLIKPERNNGKRLLYFLTSAILITSFIVAYIVNFKSDNSRVSGEAVVNPKSTESIIINETKTEHTYSKSKPTKAESNKHDETNTIDVNDNSSIIGDDNISAESNRNSNTETSKKIESENNRPGITTVQQFNQPKASEKNTHQKLNSENQGKAVIAETINGNQNSGLAISEKSKVPGEVKQEQIDATDEPANVAKSNSERVVTIEKDSI